MTLVREFHEKFDQEIRETPGISNAETLKLRLRLITEEYQEVRIELVRLLRMLREEAATTEILEGLAALTKEMADLRYVLDGTAVSFGLPLDEAFEEVHRSNMSKVWEDGSVLRDEGGKVLKPSTYSAADILSMIQPVEGEAS